MLSEVELSDWFQRLAIPEQGRAAIHQARSSDPARRVGGGHRNVSGRYPITYIGAFADSAAPKSSVCDSSAFDGSTTRSAFSTPLRNVGARMAFTNGSGTLALRRLESRCAVSQQQEVS